MAHAQSSLGSGAGRLIVGLLLLALVVWWVGLGKVADAFMRIKPAWIIPILATAYVGIAISCARWRVLLAARGISVSLHRLVFYYVIGYFFSIFLPSMFGGDVVRGYVFGKEIKSQIESFASVFMERLTGLTGLVGVAFCAALLNHGSVKTAGIAPLIYLVTAGFILFLLLLFNKALIDRAAGLIRWRRCEKWRARLLQFHDAIYSFRAFRGAIAWALFYSVLFQLLTSVNTYIVCLALGIEVPFLDIMLVIPLILLLCTLPLTPNGVGVWEAAFTIFFSRLGITEAGALSIGLVLRAKNILVAILGGVFYSILGHRGAEGDRS
ncbi:MAG: lysylphosphatidylglycerol synthase transmembrane domain-containing protein [Candidatus Aureabacteria bacterium]|nr:lysylphosphatidylglycerol synthase transmembrane domain-containing protein [Candidatus Auribacterota bacterium]